MPLLGFSHYDMTLTWESTSSDFNNASTAEIVTYCNQTPTVTGQCASIKRVSEHVTVKIGLTLEESEFKNQEFAWSLLLSTPVRVPEPYRFFRAEDDDGVESGYLVMEHIHGQSLASEALYLEKGIVDLVTRALYILHSRSASQLGKHAAPGPICGGPPSGFPWGDGKADLEFRSAQDLEHALNLRLAQWSPQSSRVKAKTKASLLSLEGTQFGLCHMDLAPRNFILANDGKIAMLDWSTAGYYPTFFEVAGLVYLQRLVGPQEKDYLESLQLRMQSWIPDTSDSVDKLECVQIYPSELPLESATSGSPIISTMPASKSVKADQIETRGLANRALPSPTILRGISGSSDSPSPLSSSEVHSLDTEKVRYRGDLDDKSLYGEALQ
ncbi:uncharacterized protein RCC_07382 [Ramularia collo-cygni]|uniref:Aminoglycoside phosphotransferase domain-containing protein n=1 Tax=Ramularia collo-cygni TaxID=112498 RepID=A0A2D3VHT9_9PEZI|nr:uncharacterized protein RCC_07382 [Ramularia collo-cygni]CZT21519.1 uncharacterized protein RCC_07382 [Ramularia collo-cygni]